MLRFTDLSKTLLPLLIVLTLINAQSATGQDNKKLKLTDVPHITKLPDFGGEACLAMGLQQQGKSFSQKDVFNLSGVDPVQGRGCNTTELVAVAKKIGFAVDNPWLTVDTRPKLRPAWRGSRQISDSLKEGYPVVCLMRQKSGDQVIEQFVLAIGFDYKNRRVTIHDPKAKSGKNRVISLEQFETAITCKAADGSQYLFCMPLKPQKLIDKPRPSTSFTQADYAQHIRKLKKRLPDDSFKIVIQEPFVVVGDQSMQQVKRHATRTVKWAVDLLKKDYFKKDPKYILDIWLFKDKESYYGNVKKIWDTKPGTPFGYYSSFNKALVMNISTGGGTLVHEIVHPFIESNFPDCPSWFNEGLASLYEQCTSRGGKIMGSTNWRLRGLQGSIRADRVPSFKELCSTTRREFYDEDPGTNYSQARYLCYYLQEQGTLRKFYHQFVKNCKNDPTGYKTLKAVLKTDDMDQFKKDWEQFVSKLRF